MQLTVKWVFKKALKFNILLCSDLNELMNNARLSSSGLNHVPRSAGKSVTVSLCTKQINFDQLAIKKGGVACHFCFGKVIIIPI